jgi:hypothetical protein
MSDEKVVSKVELINLAERAKLRPSTIMHQMKTPMIKAAKLDSAKAVEILKKKPGGASVVSDLLKRGKLKDLKRNPLVSIGYSEPTTGDPWNARNAEISGPPITSVMFCCSDGPNGSWQSRFTMPAKDDLMVMIHVSGGSGTISATLDGVLLGNYSFSGDDWIVITVSDVPAGLHTFKINQVSGFFYWLSTEYFRIV